LAATVVTAIGVLFLVLGLIGAVLAIFQSRRGPVVQPEAGVDPGAWAKLVEALAKAPAWISCAIVGILVLVFAVPNL
jgi:uncharacterized membrane protein